MLEQDLWLYTSNDIFPDCKASDNCFRGNFTESVGKVPCEDMAMLDNRDAETKKSLCQFPLAYVYPRNGDLDVFDNDHESQECSYLSYDEWPDMNYIEGFDGLFRNYDISLGQEIVINDDEMSWFSSSSHAVHASGDALEPGFKEGGALKSTLEHHGTDMVSDSVILDSDGENALSCYSALHNTCYGNCLDTNAGSVSEPVLEEQVFKLNGEIGDKMVPVIKTNTESSEMHGRFRREQIKNHKQIGVKRKDRSSEYSSGRSFAVPSTPQQFANPTNRSSDSSASDIAPTPEKNVEKLNWKHHLQVAASNKSQCEGLVNHVAFTDQVDISKQLHQTQGGSQCEVEKVSTELPDESSRLSSVGCSKISAVENTFQELQSVMEQLDARTKLCIRDSLYRLARSAEQRNSMLDSGSSSRDERDKFGARTTNESNKCTFMDVETDTNIIDRSIAHLLFRKPIEGISLNSQASASFYTFDHDPNFVF